MIFKEVFNIPEPEERSMVRIGLFGVGYDKYWGQFPGLYEELMDKQKKFVDKFRDKDIVLIDFGMVDSPKMAYDALKRI
jgi:L-arabinose isomerase